MLQVGRLALLVLSVVGVSGCVTHVMEHGGVPPIVYQITFVDKDSQPLQGVTFICSGETGTFTQYIAESLNEYDDSSNEDGQLKLVQDGYEFHDLYKKFGPFTWGHNEIIKLPNCKFLYNGSIVYSVDLNKANPQELVVVYE